VGAGYCIDRIYVGGDALCIQNAAAWPRSAQTRAASSPPGPAPTTTTRRRTSALRIS
jgi:hypothetical protein